MTPKPSRAPVSTVVVEYHRPKFWVMWPDGEVTRYRTIEDVNAALAAFGEKHVIGFQLHASVIEWRGEAALKKTRFDLRTR